MSRPERSDRPAEAGVQVERLYTSITLHDRKGDAVSISASSGITVEGSRCSTDVNSIPSNAVRVFRVRVGGAVREGGRKGKERGQWREQGRRR